MNFLYLHQEYWKALIPKTDNQESVLVPIESMQDDRSNHPGDLLIVDDMPDNLRVLSSALSNHGYRVRAIKNGTMALLGAKAAPPDVIVLDIRMPVIDGFEVCRQLKADPELAGIPVIFLSASDDIDDKARAFELGGADFIQKPFQIPEVLARVKHQIQIVQFNRTLEAQKDLLLQKNQQLQQEVDERQRLQEERERTEVELSKKTQILGDFSSSLKHLHRLSLTHFNNLDELFADYIQTGCEILAFAAGAVGQIWDQTYTFLAVQSDLNALQSGLTVDLNETFCGKVAQQRQTVAFHHIGQMADMRCHPLYQTLKLESYLGTPIWVDGKLFGTLCFFSTQPRLQGLEKHETEIIELMAQSIGKFISLQQTEARRRQAEEEVQLLLNLTQDITSAGNFDQAIEIALSSLCQATGWVYGEAWLPTPEANALTCSPIWYCNQQGQSDEWIEAIEQFRQSAARTTLVLGSGIAGRVAQQQQPEWVPDVTHWLDDVDPLDAQTGRVLPPETRLGFKSHFSVPISVIRDRSTTIVPALPIQLSGVDANPAELLAVLVFFMPESRPQDARLTQLVTGVATQLGMVLAQKQTEAELKALFQAMTDVVVVRDRQGRCLKIAPNSPFYYKPIQIMLGKTLHETFPQQTADLLLQSIQASLDDQRMVDVEYNLPINQQDTWLSARISPLSDNSVIIVARDISDRRQLELALQRSEAKLSNVLNSANAAIASMRVFTNQRWDVEYRSVGYERVFGFPLSCFEASLNFWMDHVVPEDLAQYLSQLFQDILAGRSGMAEYRFYHGDGTIHWISQIYTAQWNVASQCWVVTTVDTDISDRKQAEAALSELLAQTQQQSIELERARDAAESANRAKSEFLANMSHELRTPLNVILGFTQVLAREASLTHSARDYLATINRSGEHLLDLINDVLEMSRIEAGKLLFNPSNFNLQDLLISMEEMFSLRAQSKGLRLVVQADPHLPQNVQTDEGKLRQVLVNLLGNAIKFTQTGTVVLRVSLVAPWGRSILQDNPSEQVQLCFEVSDTGIGIDPGELPMLFEPFVQSQNRVHATEGTGLGLPISRKFVQLMQGTIQMDSQPGIGTNVTIQIPVRVMPQSEPRSRQVKYSSISLAPGQPTYRILVVEDHLESRQLLVTLLRSLQFEVKEAADGRMAIDLWQQWHPDLIWMDMHLPFISGYEATQQIRELELQQDTSTHTVIIALTASAFEEDRANVLAAGCNDFVRKPFREDLLLNKMHEFLGVEFVYTELAPQNTSSAPEPTNYAAIQVSLKEIMPLEWFEQCYQAANFGSDERLLQLINQIPETHKSVATILTNLVHNFRFEQLLILTQLPDLTAS